MLALRSFCTPQRSLVAPHRHQQDYIQQTCLLCLIQNIKMKSQSFLSNLLKYVAILYKLFKNLKIKLISKKPKMRNRLVLLLSILLIWAASATQNITVLTLNGNYSAILQAEIFYTFETVLPGDISAGNDFFFIVQWPPNDPLQNPFIDITNNEEYYTTCYNSNDQFSGVCKVSSDNLHPNTTITSNIYCLSQCQLTITPLLAKRLKMRLNETSTFTAPKGSGLPIEIEIQVGYDINYTQIAVYAQIDSIQKANEGLEMYANIGDENELIPTKETYDQIGQSIYWGGKGIFLSKEDVFPGQWIKLYLYLSQGMKVKVFSNVIFGNNFMIDLGQSYFDFTSFLEKKVYILDLRKSSQKIAGKTVSIGLLVYSGNPTVTISMESSFLNPLNLKGEVSTTTYLLTESLRKQYNFTGVVYIKIQSIWSSDYLIYTNINSKNYISIIQDLALYNELEPNDVYNYFFDDIAPVNSVDRNLSYSIKVDMIKGHTTFGIRRCKTAESDSSVLSCVINDPAATKNESVLATFEEISVTIKQSSSYYYMSFQMNASKCTLVNNGSHYYCYFHLVAIEDGQTISDYTITLNKRFYTSSLIEGSLTRDFILKGEYLYYKFMIGSLEEVAQVDFYATVIEGDIYLIGSTKDEFPTMQTASNDTYLSVGNYLTVTKDNLAKTIYLTVYGIQISEFTLGVKVTRKGSNTTKNGTSSNQTEHTKLALKLDLSQQFILQEADTNVVFLMSVPAAMNVTVEIMQLAGTVNLQVKDDKNLTVNCSESAITNNKISCTFQSKENVNYSAIVTAKKGDTQKFIIIYHKNDSCLTYSLNLPIYLELDSQEKECVLYSLSKPIELEVTSTVPLPNLINQTLQMVVCLNQNCLPPTISHHMRISKKQINAYCKFGNDSKSNIVESCSIKLSFASSISLGFQVIVEEQGKDIGLFDGIVQKINTYDLTHQNGKYFYYEIYQWSAIKIFFSSFTSNSYYIALHFVEETEFLRNSSNIYLPYRETNFDIDQKFQRNFYQSIIYGSNTNAMTISSSIIDKYCDECFLTISVYPLNADSHSLAYFEIEVTQTETTLLIGDSKLGFLQQDQIYNYQLEATPQSDAILTIKDLSKQSNRQVDCFTASVTQSNGDVLKLVNGITFISKGSKQSNLYVESIKQFCSFQVTFTRLDIPLIIATANRKYQFSKEAAAKMYILYTHTSTQSFKIVQIINTGAINLYANSLSNQSISQMLNTDVKTFAFINSDMNGEFQILNTSKTFCTNCQYLIVLEAQSAVNAEIIIANINAKISLGVNGIIKEKIVVSDLKYRNYTFNSITAFNISIGVIYGKFRVAVIDPSKKIIVNQNITKTTVLAIPHNNQTENFSSDYNSIYTQYQINVESDADCSYTIKASKETITSRLFEGLPLYYSFNPNETISLQFLNLNPANATTNSLNILLEMIEKSSDYIPQATIQAFFESKEGSTPVDLQITSLVQSDSVYNIELPLKVGTYYLKITMNETVKTSIILAKQSLIHLRPSSGAILFKENIFELYTNQKSAMIEVFTCWGDLSVDASSNFKDFSTSGKRYGEIVLQQNNYGGHFVINAENVLGEYFVKVSKKRKNQQDIGYFIKYYYYDSKDILPYKVIDLISREITYTLTKTSVTFKLDPVVINWGLSTSIESVFIQYRLYVSDNKNKISKFANCRLGQIYWTNADEQTDNVTASVEISKINEVVGGQDIYFVGAEALVWIEPSDFADEDYPEELRLIYDTIELSNIRIPTDAQQGSSYSVQMIIVWFLIPFAIAGVILYFALKYCIKKYRGLLPNELMEENDHGQSQQKVNIPDKSPLDNPNNASQSLKDDV